MGQASRIRPGHVGRGATDAMDLRLADRLYLGGGGVVRLSPRFRFMTSVHIKSHLANKDQVAFYVFRV